MSTYISDITSLSSGVILPVISFIGIPCSGVYQKNPESEDFEAATEITVIRPSAAKVDAKVAYIGIPAEISGYTRIVETPPAGVSFNGVISRAIQTIEGKTGVPAAVIDFSGVSATWAADYIDIPAAEIFFSGIPAASFNSDKLILPGVAAEIGYSGGDAPVAFIKTVITYVSGKRVSPSPAGISFSGIVPDGFTYDTLIVPGIIAEIGIAGIPAAHAGTPRQIVLSPSSAIGFDAPIAVLRDILISPAASLGLSGVSGEPKIIDYSLIASDNLMAYDTPFAGWIASLGEALTIVDSSGAARLLTIEEYIALSETLSQKWVGSVSVQDSILVLDAVSIAKRFSEIISESISCADTVSVRTILSVIEYLNIRSSVSCIGQYNVAVSDILQNTDTVMATWLKSVVSEIGATDTASVIKIIKESVTEDISLLEILSATGLYNLAVTEQISAADAIGILSLLAVSDNLSVADTVSVHALISILEYISIRGSASCVGQYNINISDTIQGTDKAIGIWLKSVISEIGATDTASVIKAINESVTEEISLFDVLSVLGIYNLAVTDQISTADTVNILSLLSASETLSITDTVTAIGFLSVVLSDTVTASEEVSPAKRSYIMLTEEVIITENVSSSAKFNVFVQELLTLDINIIVDGEVYECFVLNTSKFHPSVYSGFDFNSYCLFQGRAFGANASGIWELTGDTDNGEEIHTGVMFHDTDFGLPSQKRFRKAYLGVYGDVPVLVMESNGERRTYNIDAKGMADASRAVQGKVWTISISDFDVLESMSLVPVILARGR